MTRALLSLSLVAILLAGCRTDEPVTIAELGAMDDAEKAGKRLMRLEDGLWRLDDGERHPVAVVAVHGLASKGKEWIEPLSDLADEGVELYFVRWNDKSCPESGAVNLSQQIAALVAKSPHLERVIVVGHSYGGLIAALMAQMKPLDVEVDVHIIASPLASTKQFRKLCDFEGVPSEAPAEDIDWHQWRTVQDQDGVYADMEVDPQIIELPELEVTELPASDGDVKLGHNRSIAYVVDELTPIAEASDGATPE